MNSTASALAHSICGLPCTFQIVDHCLPLSQGTSIPRSYRWLYRTCCVVRTLSWKLSQTRSHNRSSPQSSTPPAHGFHMFQWRQEKSNCICGRKHNVTTVGTFQSQAQRTLILLLQQHKKHRPFSVLSNIIPPVIQHETPSVDAIVPAIAQ